MWLTGTFLAEDWTLFTSTVLPLLRALVGVAFATMIWTGAATLVSAACVSPNAAMVMWAVLLVGSRAVGVVIGGVLNDRSLASCVSLWDAGAASARTIGGLWQRDSSEVGAFVMLAVALAVLLLLARRKMRVTEAIG